MFHILLLLYFIPFLSTISCLQIKMANTTGVFDVSLYGPYAIPRIRYFQSWFNSDTDYQVEDVVVAEEYGMDKKILNCQHYQCNITVSTLEKLQFDIIENQIVRITYTKKQLVVIGYISTTGNNTEKTIAEFWFPRSQRMYGIPQHAVNLSLQDNMNYRLMNLDVFEYKLDDTGGIYGSIPFLMSLNSNKDYGTSGMLWLNSADTTVSIYSSKISGKSVLWASKAGIVDVFFFHGSTPEDVQRQHSSITGPVLMPPLFSLGYHQCRWNYQSVEDALQINENFDKYNIPYDVLWLDIEHTDSKKYFTWDKNNFKNATELISELESSSRKLVTIVDPHVKRENGYYVHEEAVKNKFYIQKDNKDYEGHCWPGQSSWPDFYNPAVRKWYASLFSYHKYAYSTKNVFTWIDMNEPSVFSGPEITMDEDALHYNGKKTIQHKYLHNMYGLYNSMAVYEGQLQRNKEINPANVALDRPFILTRSFFSGSQRYVAAWTGDNMAKWSHLAKSIPMILSISISNFPFIGADVGGFFYNAPNQLMLRWFQAGIFYPFLRGHSHHEAKRREPWLVGYTDEIREALHLRYSLIPYLYTVFFSAHVNGSIVTRPLFYEFPESNLALDEQQSFMFGPSLLVRPIIEEAEPTEITIYLPDKDTYWYYLPSGQQINGESVVTLPVTTNTIPMFQRGGHIVPRRDRHRRNTATMAKDPYILYVALNKNHEAHGQLFMDDGKSFAYANGDFILLNFFFSINTLAIQPIDTNGKPVHLNSSTIIKDIVDNQFIGKIIIMGIKQVSNEIYVYERGNTSKPVPITWKPYGKYSIEITLPRLNIGSSWEIRIGSQESNLDL